MKNKNLELSLEHQLKLQMESCKRFRLALQFYANHKSWWNDDSNVPSVIKPPDYGRPGYKARKALKCLLPTNVRPRKKK